MLWFVYNCVTQERNSRRSKIPGSEVSVREVGTESSDAVIALNSDDVGVAIRVMLSIVNALLIFITILSLSGCGLQHL